MSTPDAASRARSVVVTVSGVVDETAAARSLVLDVPAESHDMFEYQPGQFLTLRIPSATTGSVSRCYSLASSPHCDDAPKVTIKRTAGGYGSNWLCDNVKVGDTIEVLPPSGRFTPADLSADLLLWAAGSGITPVISIVKSALAAGNADVVLVYANRDERTVIFAGELQRLAEQYPDRLSVVHWLESVQGLPGHAQLARLAARFPGRDSFICGPAPFMDAAQHALAANGVRPSRIHREVFSSLTGNPFEPVDDSPAPADGEDAVTADIELNGRTHTLRWPRGRTLLEAMLAAGLEAPHSCREGQCGSCAATLVEGDVDMGACAILEPEDLEAGLVLACQSRPGTDEVRIEF